MKTIKKTRTGKIKPLTVKEPVLSSRLTDGEPAGGVTRLQETMTATMPILRMPDIGEAIGIRAAKAHLSALVALVEKGKNLVLMRDGEPVAKLVPYEQPKPKRKPFEMDWDFLFSQPMQTEGPFSTELIRRDRDGRW